MGELVSCVMPTGDRPRFVRQAIRCFLGQTYTDSELIVVDDGDRPVGRLCSGRARVRYVRLTRPALTGAKLNLGIEQARGRIIQKLDDDDYYHPDFLNIGVSRLQCAARPDSLVAWDCFLVLLLGEAQLRHSGHGWAAGGTFCFPRELWRAKPFRDLAQGEDTWFLRDARPQVLPVCAPEHYILVRHGRNTWTNLRTRRPVDDFFLGRPRYKKPLEDLVHPRHLAFYRSLMRGSGGLSSRSLPLPAGNCATPRIATRPRS